MLGIAHAHKEVLVAFRGRIPPALFEVINTDAGLGRGFVPELGQALLLYCINLHTQCIVPMIVDRIVNGDYILKISDADRWAWYCRRGRCPQRICIAVPPLNIFTVPH